MHCFSAFSKIYNTHGLYRILFSFNNIGSENLRSTFPTFNGKSSLSKDCEIT